MMEVANISRVYFLGIGGIGMSALARYFLHRGVFVSGYDKTPTTLSKQLEKEGAVIHYEDDVEQIDKGANLFIYTPAVPKDLAEWQWLSENDYPLTKRSEVLATITRDTFNICVAGTHGKTTISAMIAHLLRATGYGCTAFLGGIAVNYLSNFWQSDNDVCVIEADEYDRSFLKLSPHISIISAMDADHLDIYGDVETMRGAFFEFAQKTPETGLLLLRFGLPAGNMANGQLKFYSVQNDRADVYLRNITMKEGTYVFDHVWNGQVLDNLHLHMGGMHNLENMAAALAVARYLEIDGTALRKAVENFRGVKRRFEYVIDAAKANAQRHNVVFVDDYAHHPEEVKALLQGAQALFGKRKCTIVFQPHLYSRTRDLAAEFAEALDLADEVLLLPIYPARELPLTGVESQLILEHMKNDNSSVVSRDDLLTYLSTNYLETVEKSPYGQVLITAGAGNIDQLVNPIKEILQS